MAAIKLALALVALIAVSGAQAAGHSRALRFVYTVPECALSIDDFAALDLNNIAGTGALSAFQLVLGPSSAGVQGNCARNLCFGLGKKLNIGLQVANLEANTIKKVSHDLVFPNIGSAGAYINTAPTYETPREGPGIKLTSGPIGRNNLVLTSTPPTGNTFTVAPPALPAGGFVPGNGADSLAVVCGPLRDPVTQPTAFCTSPDPQFAGFAITGASFVAADITCPSGYQLAPTTANELFKKAGVPFLPDLIAFCAPGERVWANTAPGFTTGDPVGPPPGAPGFCVTVSQEFKGNPKGVDPKKNNGNPNPTDPLCLESHKALCILSTSV